MANEIPVYLFVGKVTKAGGRFLGNLFFSGDSQKEYIKEEKNDRK